MGLPLGPLEKEGGALGCRLGSAAQVGEALGCHLGSAAEVGKALGCHLGSAADVGEASGCQLGSGEMPAEGCELEWEKAGKHWDATWVPTKFPSGVANLGGENFPQLLGADVMFWVASEIPQHPGVVVRVGTKINSPLGVSHGGVTAGTKINFPPGVPP